MSREAHAQRPLERAGLFQWLIGGRVKNPRQRAAFGLGPQPRGGVADLLDEDRVQDAGLQRTWDSTKKDAAQVAASFGSNGADSMNPSPLGAAHARFRRPSAMPIVS